MSGPRTIAQELEAFTGVAELAAKNVAFIYVGAKSLLEPAARIYRQNALGRPD